MERGRCESSCLPSLILGWLKSVFSCYVLSFWSKNSFFDLFQIVLPPSPTRTSFVSCVYLCVPLPFFSPSCWCPGFFLWLFAERGCGHTVRPDEPEPAVLRGDCWAPSWSRLPAVPPATAHPTAKLCHHLHRPAAPNRGLLRLRTSHLPASPPAPSLATGICATASSCTGKGAFSQTCDRDLVWVHLCFHVEYHQVSPCCPSVSYWYPQPTGPGLSCSLVVPSPEGQKVSLMKRTQVSLAPGQSPIFQAAGAEAMGKHPLPRDAWFTGVIAQGGEASGKEREGLGPSSLLAAALEMCCFLSYPLISIFCS